MGRKQIFKYRVWHGRVCWWCFSGLNLKRKYHCQICVYAFRLCLVFIGALTFTFFLSVILWEIDKMCTRHMVKSHKKQQQQKRQTECVCTLLECVSSFNCAKLLRKGFSTGHTHNHSISISVAFATAVAAVAAVDAIHKNLI